MEDLYNGVKAIHWEEHVDVDGSFAIEAPASRVTLGPDGEASLGVDVESETPRVNFLEPESTQTGPTKTISLQFEGMGARGQMSIEGVGESKTYMHTVATWW